MSDPRRVESIIGIVRTAAPFTSDSTITKLNTYLPAFEKMSTLLGMYAFLNRAQNYAPIRSLGGKTTTEKVSALISNGNIPIGKLLAQPLITNNMDKIISGLAKNAIGNGNINDLISSMANQLKNNPSHNSGESGGSPDLSSLMETFMPLINNILSEKSSPDSDSPVTDTQDLNISSDISHGQNTFEPADNDHIQNTDTLQPEITEHVPIQDHEQEIKAVKKNTPVKIRQRKRRTLHNTGS